MSNIIAAKAVARVVRSTLGPFGMNKMLVSSSGDVTVTNDGAEILKNINVEHPVAKLLVEVAKTQDSEVGDGTTSAVILSGALLEMTEKLVESKIHPNIIVEGYKKASEKAEDVLNEIAMSVDLKNNEILKHIASTSMGSKDVATEKENLSKIAVEAVKQIAEESDGNMKADLSNVRVLKVAGEGLSETELVKGIVIEGEVDVPNMPKRVEGAKIVLLKKAIDLDRGAITFAPRFIIEAPGKRKEFVDNERKLMTEMVQKVAESGANVLLCEKAIDMYAVNFLVRKRILAVRRIDAKDMEQIAKATGGRIVSHANEISPEALGTAGIVEERKIGKNKYIYILDCVSPRSVTVVMRGGEKHVLDEAERSLHDALCAVRNTIEDPKVVVGGGACESEIAGRIKAYALKFRGREQLAVKAYAEALEVIPTALAENAGLDPIDMLVELRRRHEKDGGRDYGVDVFSGKIDDMKKLNVLEPLRVKRQMIRSSNEAVTMIIKIDDLIKSKPLVEKEEGLEDRLKQRERIKKQVKRKWSMSPVQVVR
jgi:thermosome